MGINEAVKKLLGNKWLLALTAIGLLLLLFGASGGGSGPPSSTGAVPVIATGKQGSSGKSSVTPETNSPLSSTIAYEQFYDRTLTQILDQIQGVSDVMVMVTVDSTPVVEYGQNSVISRQSTLQNGTGSHSNTTSQSTQSTLVTVQNSNGNQVPVVVSEQMPHIRGVLVVARSANSVVMQSEITNAVQDALGIPSFEITVLMRK